MANRIIRNASLVFGLAALCASPGAAQPPAKAPPKVWQLAKSEGGVYPTPMRPIWRLADLKKMHAGQANWSQQIVKDPLQEATYNSAAPGSKFTTRMHPDTATLFVVIAGQIHFTVEGQQPVTATRGSVVNILRATPFSYEMVGNENALWVEIEPADYKVVYPADVTPPPAGPGRKYVTVTFNKNEWAEPGKYEAPNQLHFNTFDLMAECKSGTMVIDDHIFADFSPRYVNPAEDKCAKPGVGGEAAAADTGKFNPKSTFGHLHVGWAEWWIVQVGGIRGRFENQGEFHAVEGDVLYAPPSTWHQMDVEAPHGPNVRFVLAAYPQFNMYTTKPSK